MDSRKSYINTSHDIFQETEESSATSFPLKPPRPPAFAIANKIILGDLRRGSEVQADLNMYNILVENIHARTIDFMKDLLTAGLYNLLPATKQRIAESIMGILDVIETCLDSLSVNGTSEDIPDEDNDEVFTYSNPPPKPPRVSVALTSRSFSMDRKRKLSQLYAVQRDEHPEADLSMYRELVIKIYDKLRDLLQYVKSNDGSKIKDQDEHLNDIVERIHLIFSITKSCRTISDSESVSCDEDPLITPTAGKWDPLSDPLISQESTVITNDNLKRSESKLSTLLSKNNTKIPKLNNHDNYIYMIEEKQNQDTLCKHDKLEAESHQVGICKINSSLIKYNKNRNNEVPLASDQHENNDEAMDPTEIVKDTIHYLSVSTGESNEALSEKSSLNSLSKMPVKDKIKLFAALSSSPEGVNNNDELQNKAKKSSKSLKKLFSRDSKNRSSGKEALKDTKYSTTDELYTTEEASPAKTTTPTVSIRRLSEAQASDRRGMKQLKSRLKSMKQSVRSLKRKEQLALDELEEWKYRFDNIYSQLANTKPVCVI